MRDVIKALRSPIYRNFSSVPRWRLSATVIQANASRSLKYSRTTSVISAIAILTVGSRIGVDLAQSCDICRRRLDDRTQVERPALQRVPLFGLIAVDVVDLVDTPLLMADDEFGDERQDT